ncbi:hypothetical protein [Endomicrobium proavitum]|uniref:Uncharacterized protein n=1 Tax=Endomicrobium proavitum TaxID=1408281 RepID=A0A0G3WLE2_9BACT|nr:hypothetical protein [Endomicrobium proavitum]AKL98715.1 exported protein of unknown function [Endomicrobium proavitum]
MLSVKTKAVLSCILLFVIGFGCGYVFKGILSSRTEYNFQHKFEKLQPLTEELHLSDVQKVLLFNILDDNKNQIDHIMKQVDPKIKIQLHMLRENIKTILDDDQKVIYLRLLEHNEAARAAEAM